MSNITVNPSTSKVPKFVDYRSKVWGDSFTWSWERPLSQVVKLAVHHSVTDKNKTTPEQIALLHKARGWAGIGYHFVITGDGTVYYVGDIGTARANISMNNEKILGICLTGDFTKELPNQEQLKALKGLCEYFMTEFPALPNIASWADVIGHQEAANLWTGADPTACPGSNWKTPAGLYDRLKSGSFDGYPTLAPVTPTPTPTPQPTTPQPTITDDTVIPQFGMSVGALKVKVKDLENNIIAVNKDMEAQKKRADAAEDSLQKALVKIQGARQSAQEVVEALA